MGMWGVGFLENDVAVDVHLQFEECLAQGKSIEEATTRVMADPPWPLDDEDDRCATYLALLACQMHYHHIVPETKEGVLNAIASGAAMALWEGATPERMVARQHLLDRLVDTLRQFS